MRYTDYYLSAPDEATALAAAPELATEGRWNTAPFNGQGALTVTRGPVTGYTEGEEGEQIPVYAEGFYILLRVPSTVDIDLSGFTELDIETAPSRFPVVTPKRELMVVSRFQALAALDEFGYLDAAEALIASDQATTKCKLAWKNALEFRRLSPMVLSMAPLLGISPEKLDEIFDYAKTVEA